MISFEDLAAALDQFAARAGGATAPAPSVIPRGADGPTAQTPLPPVDTQVSAPDADEHTDVAHLPAPVYEDHSQELDIGDVLSDEDGGGG